MVNPQMLPDPKTGIAAEFLTQVVDAWFEQGAEFDSKEQARAFLNHYFRHEAGSSLLSRQADQLASALRSHVQLALNRQIGETLIDVLEPGQTDWDMSGHVVVQVVTDDRRYIVDSLLQVANDLGWTVYELAHPQFLVKRQDSGRLIELGLQHGDAIRESWVWLELRAPLGQSISQCAAKLKNEMKLALADLAIASSDTRAMSQAMLARAGMMKDRVSAQMLVWLADDSHFIAIGQRRYDINDQGRFIATGTGLGILADDERATTRFHATVFSEDDNEELIITKDSQRSRIKQSAYLDYIGVRLFDENGRIRGEDRYLGLFTSTAYAESVFHIPVLAKRANEIMALVGYEPDSHGGQALNAALESFPREEMFQGSAEELAPILAQVINVEERREVRTYVRRGRWGSVLSALIYFPRDRYNTTVRETMIKVLKAATGATKVEWSLYVSESVLARVYLTVRADLGQVLPSIDPKRLRNSITEATRSWSDRFAEIADRIDSAKRGIVFSEGYREEYTPLEAIDDLMALNDISDPSDMGIRIYRPTPPEDGVDFRLKIFRVASEMSLSQVMPHLLSLGVKVADERPYELTLRNKPAIVYDFGLRLPDIISDVDDWAFEGRQRFIEAFEASYSGATEASELNHLITLTSLDWREVGVLRAIGRYLRQAGSQYSQAYISDALVAYPGICIKLIEYFHQKFSPNRKKCQEKLAILEAEISEAIADVRTLDEDRIFTQYLEVLNAMVRTNFFARKSDEDALAFKLSPAKLSMLASPRPVTEIFVYSPRLEGCFLSFGQIARGGLIWSDRAEDYRAEILGLAKRQKIENALIVPSGAGGGFYSYRQAALTGDEKQREGQACYELFVNALLSLTDNVDSGENVYPQDIVCYDSPSPYLVLTADKGTSSFTPIAKQLAKKKNFWLGDVFCSGGEGSFNQQHSKITALGSWVSGKRHLSELGMGEEDEFSVVGIGDIGDELFSSAMLFSKKIRLVAAFDDNYVFIDPNPDPLASWQERCRVSQLAKSSWQDYRQDIISAGGGVYDRAAKAISISAEAGKVLNISAQGELSSDDLVSAILKAPVDMIWDSGIGTFIKASTQSNDAVGDKANDSVRVNGAEVRAKCLVEGAKLGVTMNGRVEYARAGGRINADFLDCSAAVDISDYEVNIKILIDQALAARRLTIEESQELFAACWPQVKRAALDHCVAENEAVAAALIRAATRNAAYEELMVWLGVDRQQEELPTSEAMGVLTAAGRGLTAPKIAKLLALVKNRLQAEILASDLPEDPYIAARLISYFPNPLAKVEDLMITHPLAREIIATVAANRFVDSQGLTAAHRLAEETGASIAEVIRAQLLARNLLAVADIEIALRRSAGSANLKNAQRLRLRKMVERATRWVLQEMRLGVNIAEEITIYGSSVSKVIANLAELLTPAGRNQWHELRDSLVAGGLAKSLADRLADCRWAQMALPIVHLANASNYPLKTVAKTYFSVREICGADLVMKFSENLGQATRWDIMARASMRNELWNLQEQLTKKALAAGGVENWWNDQLRREHILAQITQSISGPVDLARVSVALQALRSLL